MTVQQAYTQLMYRLYDLYDDRESATIADMVVERVTGFRKIDRIMHKHVELNPGQETLYNDLSDELLRQKPIQYVLQECWFYGLPFYVDERVLIPRRETEELVEWVISEAAAGGLQAARILDIGTGSGCIPITLNKHLPSAEVHAVDISAGALQVAQQNAATHHAGIIFHQLDILDASQWQQLPLFDMIVSNPPYVARSEMQQMQQHVLGFEPHLALFVPDHDALVFYHAIAQFAQTHLQPDGAIYVEINESLGEAVCRLFRESGFPGVMLRNDLQGKARMVKAWR